MKVGASARRGGHQYERDLAHHLTREWLYSHAVLDLLVAEYSEGILPDVLGVVTSRSKAANVGEDLVLSTGPKEHDWLRLPVSIEAKNWKQQQPQGWLDQAHRQADGRPYVVISKWRHHSIGESRAIWSWCPGFAEAQLDTWVANFHQWMEEWDR